MYKDTHDKNTYEHMRHTVIKYMSCRVFFPLRFLVSPKNNKTPSIVNAHLTKNEINSKPARYAFVYDAIASFLEINFWFYCITT